MEYPSVHDSKQELSSNLLQAIKSLIKRHKALCFFVLLSASGCAHNPNINIEEPILNANVIPSSGAKIDDNNININIKENNLPNKKPKCKILRVVPCKWIQQKCPDGTKPVTYIGCS